MGIDHRGNIQKNSGIAITQLHHIEEQLTLSLFLTNDTPIGFLTTICKADQYVFDTFEQGPYFIGLCDFS